MAIKREQGAKKVATGMEFCNIDSKRYWISGSALRFIKAFDAGKPVKPQNFIFREV
jgi:hypothetical protein